MRARERESRRDESSCYYYTCMHTCIHTCIHTYMITYICTYVRSYIHIHAHTHAYIGAIPEIVCDNRRCARPFHAACLCEWLRGKSKRSSISWIYWYKSTNTDAEVCPQVCRLPDRRSIHYSASAPTAAIPFASQMSRNINNKKIIKKNNY